MSDFGAQGASRRKDNRVCVYYVRRTQAEAAMLTASAAIRSGSSSLGAKYVEAFVDAARDPWQIRDDSYFVTAATADQMRARTNWGNLLPPASNAAASARSSFSCRYRTDRSASRMMSLCRRSSRAMRHHRPRVAHTSGLATGKVLARCEPLPEPVAHCAAHQHVPQRPHGRGLHLRSQARLLRARTACTAK
jgi:hypothetical protein